MLGIFMYLDHLILINSEAGGPGRSWRCGWSPKAVSGQSILFLRRPSSLLSPDLHLSEWGHIIEGAASFVNSSKKMSYINRLTSVWQNIWMPWPSQVNDTDRASTGAGGLEVPVVKRLKTRAWVRKKGQCLCKFLTGFESLLTLSCSD